MISASARYALDPGLFWTTVSEPFTAVLQSSLTIVVLFSRPPFCLEVSIISANISTFLIGITRVTDTTKVPPQLQNMLCMTIVLACRKKLHFLITANYTLLSCQCLHTICKSTQRMHALCEQGCRSTSYTYTANEDSVTIEVCYDFPGPPYTTRKARKIAASSSNLLII